MNINLFIKTLLVLIAFCITGVNSAQSQPITSTNDYHSLHDLPGGSEQIKDAGDRYSLSNKPRARSQFSVIDSLPDGFPELVTHEYNNPLPGYNFICPYKGGNHYLIIMDNWSTPVFYRRITGGMADFKIQPNGMLTYYSNMDRVFYGMNDQFFVVDTFTCQNGYGPVTDMHELRIDKNGHYFLLGYDPQLVNMDTVVPGGHPEAVVTGLIVQEMDADDNMVFQWRSWDHFKITDAYEWVNLLDSVIDYVHGNSIEIDSDTSLLISCRNMNEITKIDRRTGEIIWRMNGENNDFLFINDNIRYIYQHSIRYMPDSHNLSIFDNGLGHQPVPYSSALEYKIDEVNKTAILIKRLYKEPKILGSYMGHTQRHQNGTTTIGWGSVDTSTHTQGYDYIPGITEFNANDEVALEISIPKANYRAFKYNWFNNCLVPDSKKIEFTSVLPNDSASAICYIRNNMSEAMTINRIINRDNHFYCNLNGPVSIPSMDSIAVKITYVADETISAQSVFTFCCDTEDNGFSQRIACQVHVVGNPDPNDIEVNGEEEQGEIIELFPNPAREQLNIDLIKPCKQCSLIVYNMSGNKMGAFIIHEGGESLKLDLSDYSDGIYVTVLINDRNILASRKFIVKH